ncbi:MAG: DUF6048 family protein [Bacteroidota bacterium]
MKQTAISLFSTSLIFLLATGFLFAQEPTALDTIDQREKYGIRVGTDLSKLARSFFQDDYDGFEIMGDYRVYDNFYAAAEIGSESLPFSEDNISVVSTGQYVKIGVDYNAYENWTGMENMIFAGLRYGFSTFKQELHEYTIYNTSQFFGPDVRNEMIENSGLNASWIELIGGLKVEILNNLYLTANVQVKRRLFQKTPNNFDNLTIPGFNRTYDDSNFGVGYGYGISYLIPIYKK